MYRNVGQETAVVGRKLPAAVEQLKNTDDRAGLIADWHAIDVAGTKAQPRIEAGIETIVPVCVRDIDDFSILGHGARDSRSDGDSDFLVDFLSNQ